MPRPEKPPLPDYFANLILWPAVSRVDDKGKVSLGMQGDVVPRMWVVEPDRAWPVTGTPAGEVLRMLKPCGGVAMVTLPWDWVGDDDSGRKHPATEPVASPKARGPESAPASALAALAALATPVADWPGGVAKVVRGPLAGAGSWTHEYGEPGNTGCSDDRAVRGPLDVLWYGEPGPGGWSAGTTVPRPRWLSAGGCSSRARKSVMAYDAYNGVELWVRPIKGARRAGMSRNCSNLAADANSLYVAVGAQCLRLDATSGENAADLPPARRFGPFSGGACPARRRYYRRCHNSGGPRQTQSSPRSLGVRRPRRRAAVRQPAQRAGVRRRGRHGADAVGARRQQHRSADHLHWWRAGVLHRAGRDQGPA